MKNLYTSVLLALLLIGSSQSFAQVPVYNSYPSAPAVLFLDFDGHTVNGTSWNYNGPIVCGPSNLNNDQITQVFNRVAEDYRPFNINVTTDSTKYWSAPANRRMRLILTITSSWYGSAGGVAYINSFSWGDNTPSFVFTALLNYNTKNISEAASHELGHTLGLRHQSAYDGNCNKTSEYNTGIGSGEIGWAPIMGIGYYRNFSVWHLGPNPYGCTSNQNDISVITNTTNGFGYRPDDHTDAFNSATSATLTNNQFVLSGVVARSDDKDLFKFSVPKTMRFKLDAVPFNVGTGNSGSNLDAHIDLFNNKTLIASYNPGAILSVVIDTILNAGTYHIRIDGQGNEFASEYGSLGSYSLEGSLMEQSPLPVRKLELKGLTEGNYHKLNWLIDADETVVKQVLEVSFNGRTFEPLGEPGNDDRMYRYLPNTSNSLQYRLQVNFDNGKQHYSNIIAIKNNLTNSKPQLYTNTIRGNNMIVSSPSVYSYVITDYNGRIILRGNLTQGSSSINIQQITPGSYIIKFTNGEDQHIERFIKQ